MNSIEKSTLIATMGLMCFLTASNLSAAKAIQLYDIRLTAGFFTYPFVYLCSAVIAGTRTSTIYNQSICFAYAGYLCFITLMYLSSLLPSIDPSSSYNQSFNTIYNLSNYRIFLSSLCAYFLSMYLFGVLFNTLAIQNMTLKIGLATFIVALIDVNLFLILAFWGVKSFDVLFDIMFWASIKKLLAQALLVMPSVWIINYIRNQNEYCFSN
ncbi:VUT family protein [Vibrio caribbeanicus]|uniref:VUT family protein n=1 Tax=Vibrio caribbeanicus TaxID=701175 RepID=UPI00228335EB|nr:VUT family protein [Vibrio caribbeanicus]MCY9846260.1 VUT family protein [Vibrio caribbeanicus]